MVEELEREIAKSGLNATRWILGGATGGVVATWVNNDLPEIALASGVVTLVILLWVMDLYARYMLGFPES